MKNTILPDLPFEVDDEILLNNLAINKYSISNRETYGIDCTPVCNGCAFNDTSGRCSFNRVRQEAPIRKYIVERISSLLPEYCI